MPSTIDFGTESARFRLPLLFAGQAQKEFFVNEAHARIDALLHCAVLGESDTPPASPVDGETWIVGNSATGDWEGQGATLACRQGGNWLFVDPVDGLRVFDISIGQSRLFSGSWQNSETVLEPSGGMTVDTEARAAITQLITVLRASGVLPNA